MWDAFWNWMPDVKPGTLEIRDIASLFVAGLALALSIIAIRMARRQEAMMVEQGKIVDKQLEMMTLEVETGKRIEAITKRQGEIAEFQHKTHLEQAARVPKLTINTSPVWLPPDGMEKVKILLFNEGTAPSMACRWKILIPISQRKKYQMLMPDGERVKSEDVPWERQMHDCITGAVTTPIHPGVPVHLLTIHKPVKDELTLWWSIESEQGRIPVVDYERLYLPHWRDPLDVDNDAVDKSAPSA